MAGHVAKRVQFSSGKQITITQSENELINQYGELGEIVGRTGLKEGENKLSLSLY